MNIYALPGTKVMVTEETKKHGHERDQENIEKYLEIGKEYTVDHTVIHNWNTNVFLKEFPGVIFNSVNFEDVTLQTKEDNKLHPDYNRYN